ncbi:hypothetical protein [Halioglobus maricola]|uniref:hypothetical protein n=1 Tax=Halioglobus maricola TaxID=2601894 RepID=UPI00197AAB61|nr:hypothetical protein [Halioglobus maricola]
MKAKNMLAAVTVGALTLTVGCASNPDKIGAAYVSTAKYQQFSCPQVAEEMDYVGQRTRTLYNQLKRERTADNWQMGVGLVLFWPALFALEGGDGPEAAEYANLQGEYEALRKTSIQKNCAISALSPEEIIKGKDQKSRQVARTEAKKFDPKHRDQVAGVANAMMCEEYVSLLSVEEDKETWLLGCGDGEQLHVDCFDDACYVRDS